ncbi:MAG: magnesium transporter [bacterium]
MNDDTNQNAERDFTSEIIALITDHGTEPSFAEAIGEYHPFDVAQALIAVDAGTRNRFFTTVPIDTATTVFEHFEADDAIAFIKELPTKTAVEIIDHMETDDAVDLLQYLEETESDIDLVNQLSPKKRNELKKYWSYTDEEIGSAMSNSFIELGVSMKVTDAMKKVTSVAGETEYISILYVVDRQKLVGYLFLKQLILARAQQTIGDIMETRVIAARPHDDKETVARMIQDYGHSSLPIVDEENRMVGIVTHDDLMDIIADIKSEDYAKFAALSAEEIAIETESVAVSVKSRLPWLFILVGLSMVSSIILSVFESRMSAAGAFLLAANLAIYLPLLLDMSGNSGTQSLAVMIRYLTTRKNTLTRLQIRRQLIREIGTGVVEGLAIGAIVFAVSFVVAIVRSGWPADPAILTLGIVTAGSIAITLMVATFLGAFVPLVMVWLKKDPAVASGPFITTIADIITLTIYYTVSLAVLLPL